VFWSLPEHFFEVIVIGGDHAGVGVTWAAGSALGTGGRVALDSMASTRIGAMSRNLAIDGRPSLSAQRRERLTGATAQLRGVSPVRACKQTGRPRERPTG
jgi:tRNA U34 5-carboxymethylaminomethyl modifying enzyme MnmG/GidA